MQGAPPRLAGLVLLALAACGDAGSPSPPTGRPRGPGHEELAPKPPEQPSEQLAPRKPVFDDDTPSAEPAAGEETKPAAEDKEERDLGAELKAALGSPVSCLEPRSADEAPGRIVISVDAHVVGSGRVSRASVQAGRLRPTELDCIRRRAEAIRLPGPIEGAPLGVSATVELELQKPSSPGPVE